MDRPTTDMSTGIPKSPEAWEWREYADYLEAENAALVEAARVVVEIHRMNSVHPCEAMDKLSALLQQGEENNDG